MTPPAVPRTVRRAVLVGLTAGALQLTGCGSDSGGASPPDPAPATSEPSDGDAGTVGTRVDDLGSPVDDAELPDGWPVHILPMPAGFDVSSSSGDGSAHLWVALTARTEDGGDVAAVLNDFAGRLEERGYDVSVHEADHVFAERPGERSGTRKTVEISIIADGPDDTPQLRVDYDQAGNS